MLVTNFSSGELSESLFGRIDLGQYYQGAAKIENFDIIPTGGIKRRSGTERLRTMEGPGRIIPFVIDRERSFLLHLSPGKITAYGLSGGKISGNPKSFVSSASLKVYNFLEEILEVQYAQNFDRMILCQENYQPLEIKYSNGQLDISLFNIDINVELVAKEGIDTNPFKEKDEKYQNNGWLSSDNKWPRTATFFNGRLIFAGTKANPQRLFASSVEDIRKFATYKKFISEVREYITINGKVSMGTNIVEIIDSAEIGKFTKNPQDYHVDSSLYPAGTKVSGLQVKNMLMSNNAKAFSLSSAQNSEFLSWKNSVEYGDQWSGDYQIFSYVSTMTAFKIRIRYRNGKYEYTIREELQMGVNETPHIIDLNNAQKCVTDRDYLYETILGNFSYYAGSNYSDYFAFNVFNQFIDDFWDYIQSRMQKSFILEGIYLTLYGTPLRIQQQISSGNVKADCVIALYTKDYIFDRYPTADCGFTFEIASDSSDAIRWLTVNKGLIVGTETGEWIIPPGVSAINVQAVRNSSYGSDKVQGTAIGDAACFFQAGKKSLVEYYIPQQDNNFRANNMAVLSPEMLTESGALEFDFVLSPHANFFITREDGKVVTLLYDRSLGVFAWTRRTGAGEVKSLAVVPGASGYDDVFLLVEYLNGCYLERFDYDGKVFLDSFTHVERSTWAAAREAYPAHGIALCRVIKRSADETLYEALDADKEPDWNAAGDVYIGYSYKSIMRTLPILANEKMSKQRITNLTLRFLESYLPLVSSIAAGENIKTDKITNINTPYSGVHKMPFPGSWDAQVQVELVCEKPEPVKILSLNAEVQ